MLGWLPCLRTWPQGQRPIKSGPPPPRPQQHRYHPYLPSYSLLAPHQCERTPGTPTRTRLPCLPLLSWRHQGALWLKTGPKAAGLASRRQKGGWPSRVCVSPLCPPDLCPSPQRSLRPGLAFLHPADGGSAPPGWSRLTSHPVSRACCSHHPASLVPSSGRWAPCCCPCNDPWCPDPATSCVLSLSCVGWCLGPSGTGGTPNPGS